MDRTFTYDVTFTRTGAGDAAFPTFGLVDGGIVAREADTFKDGTSPVPLPASALFLISGLAGLGALRKARKG